MDFTNAECILIVNASMSKAQANQATGHFAMAAKFYRLAARAARGTVLSVNAAVAELCELRAKQLEEGKEPII